MAGEGGVGDEGTAVKCEVCCVKCGVVGATEMGCAEVLRRGKKQVAAGDV